MVDRALLDAEGGNVAADLLNRIRGLIEELKDARRGKDVDDCRVADLRNMTKELMDQLLDSYPEFAIVKDVEGLFWKEVVYRTFESLQRIYKQSQDKQQAGESLRLYLNESSGFYWRFRDRLLQQDPGSLLDSSTPEWMRTAAFKCYIRLGDLARYHAVHSENGPKDFSSAVRCYEFACRFLPFNGNAHNQLAVVATYRGDAVAALYHYYRAILNGFQISNRNAELLLDAFAQTERATTSSTIAYPEFAAEFLSLHRLLFTADNLRKVPSLMESVVQKYAELLNNGALDRDACCKVTMINISEYHIAKHSDSKSTAFARLFLLKMFFTLAVECEKCLEPVTTLRRRGWRLPAKARSLLPSIRLHVKHFIQDRDIYQSSRSAESEAEARAGWRAYTSLIDRLRSAYPYDTGLHDWLEEDVECFGFTPLGQCGSGWRDNPVIDREQWIIRCRDMVADHIKLGDPLLAHDGIDSQPPELGAVVHPESVRIRQNASARLRDRSSNGELSSAVQMREAEDSDDEEVILLSLPSRRQGGPEEGRDVFSTHERWTKLDKIASPSGGEGLCGGALPASNPVIQRTAAPKTEESDGEADRDYAMEKMVYDIVEDTSDSGRLALLSSEYGGMISGVY